MGTLQTAVTLARYKLRAPSTTIYSDAEILAVGNGILRTIYDQLVAINSSFVFGHGTITTVDGTVEYAAPAAHMGFIRVWPDGYNQDIPQVTEVERPDLGYEDSTEEGWPPVAYYFTEEGDDKVGFIPTPDSAYTVHVYYQKPPTALTTMATDNLPYDGIWDPVFVRMLCIELADSRERPFNLAAASLDGEWSLALMKTYQRGTLRRRQGSNMFSDLSRI